jgi:hypothetical protein
MKQAWQSKQELEISTLENLIQKDVTRTDRSVKFFDNKQNLSRQKLLNILMTYCVYHPEPGYGQGLFIYLNNRYYFFFLYRYDRYGSTYSICHT